MLRLSLLLVVITVTSCACASADNSTLWVTPAPGAVTVDGQTADWDFSGGLPICPDPAQREINSLWLHAMYDQDNLYVLAQFAEPCPLRNRYRAGQADLFKDESLRLRLLTDRRVQISAAVDATGQPVVQLAYDDFSSAGDGTQVSDALAAGARFAAVKHPDGKGCTLELALPWKLLSKSGHAYGSGEGFRLIAQGLTGWYYYVRPLVGPFAADSHAGVAWLDSAAWGEAKLAPGQVHLSRSLPPPPPPGPPCLVFAGDSITGWSDRSQWMKFSELVALMLEARAGAGKYTVANRGWGGDSTGGLLARLDKDVLPCRPQITVLMIGGNDSNAHVPREETARNLDLLITRLEAAGSRVLLMQYHVLDNPESPSTIWRGLAGNNDLIAATAARHGLPVLNLAPRMERALNDNRRSELASMNDGVHLNPGGEIVIARAVFDKLLELGWVQ
ncbi:MAG TPA: GDSL-type esterase/lipase family protein [Armatimonadota bacterium]|jgi:lysophospholipase L1-like esterase